MWEWLIRKAAAVRPGVCGLWVGCGELICFREQFFFAIDEVHAFYHPEIIMCYTQALYSLLPSDHLCAVYVFSGTRGYVF